MQFALTVRKLKSEFADGLYMSETQIRQFVEQGMSHVQGSTEEPLLEQTIPELIATTVSKHAHRDAVVFADRGIRWSWQQFSNEIDKLAAGFLALGLQKGDRLGVWSPNRPEWVLTQFATARLGIILVAINPAFRSAELAHVLKASGCKALLMARKFKSSNYLKIFQYVGSTSYDSDSNSLRVASLPELVTVICMGGENEEDTPSGMIPFDQVGQAASSTQRAQLNRLSAELSADEAINIQFTSGTTGLPKGATLSHRNILNNGKFTTDTLLFTEQDRLCIPVPLYHCFGMVMGTLGCAPTGAAMIFPGEGFDSTETIRTIEAEKCTALYGVPTMFNAILALEDFFSYDLSSLRTGIMAGAPCPIETMNRVVNDMNMSEVTIAYGMTETSPVSFQCNVDDPLEKRVTTVGRVHPHVECRIIDAAGSTLPVGQSGELCTRGYSVMKGYWDDDQKTKAAIDSDGWMHSGDLATMDDEGYCNIVGRVKDMIIRGGENVYPKEIEDYIYKFSKVKDVQVFGIPDSKFGEVVCAWIVVKPGETIDEDEVIEFCSERIAHYKVPRYVRIREELPMTVSGKAQKYKMREEMVRELSLLSAH